MKSHQKRAENIHEWQQYEELRPFIKRNFGWIERLLLADTYLSVQSKYGYCQCPLYKTEG